MTVAPEIEMFRSESVDLDGGADFYATVIEGLREEGRKSLEIFLEMCHEDGVEPRKEYSGRFNLRVLLQQCGKPSGAESAGGPDRECSQRRY